jgi:hypothetical protein
VRLRTSQRTIEGAGRIPAGSSPLYEALGGGAAAGEAEIKGWRAREATGRLRSDVAGLLEEAGAGPVEHEVGPGSCCGVAGSRQAEKGRLKAQRKRKREKKNFSNLL